VIAAPVSAALAGDRARPAPPPGRAALALGFVGALGDELLSVLLGDTTIEAVHVAVSQPIGSATSRFRPLVFDRLPPDASAWPPLTEAWLLLGDENAFVPRATVMQRLRETQVLEAARLARAAGARRLVLIAPLSALLQSSAVSRHLGNDTEVALVRLGFEHLVIVRPAAAGASAGERGGLAGLVRAAGRALAEIMLPAFAQALSPRSAALAIVTAARDARPGVTIVGARELLAIVEARFPQLRPRRRRLR
jgi:hypothetical protein